MELHQERARQKYPITTPFPPRQGYNGPFEAYKGTDWMGMTVRIEPISGDMYPDN